MKAKLLLIALLIALTVKTNAQWEHLNFPTGRNIDCVIVIGDTILAGAGDVYISKNNGTSWALDSESMNIGYTSFALSGNNLFAGTWSGVFVSANNGISWMPDTAGMGKVIVRALAVIGDNILAGTDSGVFISNNGGMWTPANTGLSKVVVNAFAISGSNVFAGAAIHNNYNNVGGVFLSTDTGKSWMSVNNGLTDSSEVNALAVMGTKLFAATQGGGVSVSMNNGSSWMLDTTGMGNKYVRAFDVIGNNIFAGIANFGGVYLSTNEGVNWTTDIASMSGYVLSFAHNEKYIFAGTENLFWRRSLSDISAVENITDPGAFSIYPNPLTSSSILQCKAGIKDALVVIYDVLGKERMRKSFTGNSTRIEKGNLESSVYFVVLICDQHQYIQRIIIG